MHEFVVGHVTHLHRPHELSRIGEIVRQEPVQPLDVLLSRRHTADEIRFIEP